LALYRARASGTALPRKALRDPGSLDPRTGHSWDWLRAYQPGLSFHYLPGPNLGSTGRTKSSGASLEERRRDLEAQVGDRPRRGFGGLSDLGFLAAPDASASACRNMRGKLGLADKGLTDPS
jgi:hypothetical protein